jgi:hypothetical protein
VGGLFIYLVFSLVLLTNVFLRIFTDNKISVFDYNNNHKYSLFEPSPAKIVGFAVVYMLFFFKKRHESIYEKCKDDEFLNSKKAKRIAYTVLISIYLAPSVIPLLLGWY